jgi:hypothetical protein
MFIHVLFVLNGKSTVVKPGLEMLSRKASRDSSENAVASAAYRKANDVVRVSRDDKRNMIVRALRKG